MRKIIFVIISIVSILFISCDCSTKVPTEVRIVAVDGKEVPQTFKDFFDPVILVQGRSQNGEAIMDIIMDANTGVLYVRRSDIYEYGISPIYDADGTILTKEKWLFRQTFKEY